MKKILAMVVAMVMIIAMVGCGKSDKPSNSGVEISETHKVAPAEKPSEETETSDWLEGVNKIDTYIVDFSEGDYFEVKFTDQTNLPDLEVALYKLDGATGTLIFDAEPFVEGTVLEIKVYHFDDKHWGGAYFVRKEDLEYEGTLEDLETNRPNIVITSIEGGPKL